MSSLSDMTSAAMPSRLRRWSFVGLLICAYLVLDRVSYLFPMRQLDITPWNPLAGLCVFVILRYGNMYAVVIGVARILSDILVRHEAEPLPIIVGGAIIIVAGYTLIAAILRKMALPNGEAPTLHGVGVLVITVLTVAAVRSVAYVGFVFAFGALDESVLFRSWLRGYVGDVSGIISVLPALVSFAPAIQRSDWRAFRPAPVHLVQGLAVLWIVGVLFGVEPIDESKFFYVLFLPLIWIAVQGGYAAAAVGVLWTQAVIVAAFCFLANYDGRSATEIQILMITLAVTGLMLGTVVSERRSAELQLVEKQAELNEVGRRAASGELASVIAHELNQPLTAVVYYARSAQMMWQRKTVPAPMDEILAKASTQANRAAEILRRLRTFIGRGVNAPTIFTVNELIAEAVKLAMPAMKAEGIALRTMLLAEAHTVRADRVQISQVLDNLLRNAIDAMAASGRRPRILTVKSVNDAAGHVVVRIADTGGGVPADIAERIFQPFVSSKKQGMGLGLAICKTIIAAHEGELWYEPAEDGGAVFSFNLHLHSVAHELDA